MNILKLKAIFKDDKSRSIKAKKNICLMLLIKGLSILINLAFVPLLIDVLNSEVYGIWLTITSIIAWLGFFDVGLGHGLRNKLADAAAKHDIFLARSYVSTTYIALSCVVCLLLLLQTVFIPLINWCNVLNAPVEMKEELQMLVMCVFTLFCIQFLLKLITSIMMALQMPAFSSLVITLGQLFSFLIIWILINFDLSLSLLYLGVIISLTPVVVLFIASIWVFCGKYKIYSPSIKFFDKQLLASIFSLGGKFFMIQLTSILIFQTNNIIIAQTCGPSDVTEFNIAYKYMGIVYMIFSIITTPYWSATTEAYLKKDYKWINSSLAFLNKIFIAFCVFGLMLVLFSKYAYNLWLGNSIEINYIVIGMTFIYYLLQMKWSVYGNFINGIGKVRLQFYITAIEAIIHVPLAYFLGTKLGIAGVLGSMIFITFINAFWPKIQLEKIMNGSAKGVWNK